MNTGDIIGEPVIPDMVIRPVSDEEMQALIHAIHDAWDATCDNDLDSCNFTRRTRAIDRVRHAVATLLHMANRIGPR